MSFELLNTVLLLVSGGFLIFLAITVTRDSFKIRLNRTAGAMLFFAGLGPLFMALEQIISFSTPVAVNFEDAAAYQLYIIWEFFFPLLLLFTWVYPEDRIRHFRYRWIKYVIFIPPLLHLLVLLYYENVTQFLNIFSDESSREGIASIILKPLATFFSWLQIFNSIVRTYHTQVFNVIFLIYVIAAEYFLGSDLKQLTSSSLRTQARMVIWGIRIALGLYVLTVVFSNLLSLETANRLYSFGIALSVLTGAVTVGFATVRHQFLNVRLVLRQSFVYTVTYAILVGAFVVLVIKSEDIMAPMFGGQAEVFSYVFIVLLLLFFQPLSNWIDNIIKSMFIRTRTDHRNVLERFSRQIISILDPRQLREIISETLKTALLVDQVYFVMFDDKIEEYALLATDRFPRQLVLDRDDKMLLAINRLTSPQHIQALGNFEMDVKLARALEERNVRLILPMKEGSHLLGFVGLTDKAAGYRYTSEDLNLLNVLSNQMVTALINARLYVESIERLRLQEEMAMARQIQLDLLPSSPPKLTTLSIAVYSAPSRTVGGDFYDFINLNDNRLGMVIADASGKGMPAALMIAQIQAMIRSEVNNGIPISNMLRNINQQIATSTSSEKYVTLFYGELNHLTGEFIYSNAGHNYPLLVRSNGRVERLETGGTVIGALPMVEFDSSSVKLEPEDILFLFTDGLSEAMNETEQEYGEGRIRDMICQHFACDPDTLVNNILDDVKSFDSTYPPRDDTTIIALKMNHGSSLEGLRI